MPRYNYVALDARGEESTGLLEAGSTNEAIGQLRQAGYFPTNVYEEGQKGNIAVNYDVKHATGTTMQNTTPAPTPAP